MVNTIVTRFVKEIDPLSFIFISFVNEVFKEEFGYPPDNGSKRGYF
ncbi:hypothetical protein HMPREF9013_0675 [Bulleidia extructa W1219]|uniref:Uncharacterized protein n=1 Tax=Bulleidia extructa W1219 TaxID=679192 RepID=D2MNY2_9FIRM|nr:hypothetical protein [Bulleidia extructa]EFC05751.1 hypothetical protein HMPREF9013_0675 [Bulleidia extructa W1219]